ncbi:hypothetical protein [Microbacterium suwonense]|uniref:Uncharacterized protein n=1 Tax=Microbacterium suwonense TaxID=683047 RepID=A0ABM8FRH3_9MICO|nr:hypothetical protein [Microbacterium suwonense]BDZ38061.1 hypothetical protein GCM10025863_06750 [Microbacterium suwonense]
MDQPIVILLYALLVVIVVLYFVGRVLKKKARNAGNRRAEANKARQAADEGLGATVTVHADVDTVRELVAPIFESTKRVRRVSDGTWAHTHYNDDDVVYELAPVPDGTLVAVSRAIEFAGTLNGMKPWAKLRQQIVAAAAERGITAIEGARPLVRSGETGPTGATMWRPSA